MTDAYSVDEQTAAIWSLRVHAFLQLFVEIFVVNIAVLHQSVPLQQQQQQQLVTVPFTAISHPVVTPTKTGEPLHPPVTSHVCQVNVQLNGLMALYTNLYSC